jgi:ATP:ADP antiporter, AAA family
MNAGKFWLRTFNVRPDEWGSVQKLFLMQFFQGAGIAFFFTSAFSQFLEKFPVTELPWVMVLSSALLWLTGFTYTRLEHRYSVAKLSVIVTLLMATSILVFYAGNNTITSSWFYYALLAWFNVLYLFNSLEFWGIAAQLFDVRQSKRLFGVISAGDIPAKLIGYSLAGLLVKYAHIEAKHLQVAAVLCMLLSLPFINVIASLKKEFKEDPHPHKHHGRSSAKLKALVKNFTSNKLIRRIALLALLSSICIIIINFGFYMEVKEQKHDEALAAFIAFFLAILRTVSLITKMIFTSRLVTAWGIRRALFITPAVMILLVAVVPLSAYFSGNYSMVFYVFGIAAIATDVLRTSINSPVLLTTMQPLPTHERLRAHNIVKGIMDPFAYLFAGVLLFVLYRFYEKIEIITLSYVLFLLGVLWLTGIFKVNQEYLKTLIKTISSRFFGQDEFSLEDEAVKKLVIQKIESGNEQEVINILRMLKSRKNNISEDLILKLLDHPSDLVKLEALRAIDPGHISSLKERLAPLLNQEGYPQVVAEAIRLLGESGHDNEMISACLNSENESTADAATSVLLQHGNSTTKKIAEEKLLQLVQSDNKNKRIRAATVLGRRNMDHYSNHLIGLLKDGDMDVKTKAVEAAGMCGNNLVLEHLLTLLPGHFKQVVGAFYNAGKDSIPVIIKYISSQNCTADMREKLIALCGKTGGEEVNNQLTGLLARYPQHSAAIARALYRNNYKATDAAQKQFEEITKAWLAYAADLLHMQKRMQAEKEKYAVLNNSLQIELNEIRETLLCLFGCLYHKESITRVRSALHLKNKEAHANAMEIIDITIRKDFARHFSSLYEPGDIEHRCDSLKALFPENIYKQVEHIISRILSEKPITYHDWTKACSLYVSGKYKHIIEYPLLQKYRDSDKPLLSETAAISV